MTVSFIKYKLSDGYIDHWLTAGPQIIEVEPKSGETRFEDYQERVFNDFYEEESGITELPVERGPVTDGNIEAFGYKSNWSYYKCEEDHLVNHSESLSNYAFMRSWAYSRIRLRKSISIYLVIENFGRISVWINGKNELHSSYISSESAQKISLKINLTKGDNEILVRFEQVGSRFTNHAFSLKVSEDSDGLKQFYKGRVQIPSTIPNVHRRNEFEHAFQYAYLTRDIYSSQSAIEVQWVKRKYKSAVTHVRLQNARNQIFSEATDRGRPGDHAHLYHSMSLPEGPYNAVVMPVPREMYEESIRIRKILNLWVVGNHQYTTKPTGDFGERKAIALKEASMRSGNLFAELAKMAAEHWETVNVATIKESSLRVTTRQQDSSKELLGLLGMVYRFGDDDHFPVELHTVIQDCAIGYAYSAIINLDPQGQLESDQLLYLTCKLLACQKFQSLKFEEDGEEGANIIEKIEPEIEKWLLLRGQEGFSQWDSDQVLTDTLISLSYLIDFAESELIFDLASILFDKILVGIAINSFGGGLSSCMGFGSTMGIKGSVTQAVAGITRLLWGKGIYNHHLAGYVSVALMENYQMPPIVADLACADKVIDGREKHHEASKATYRTENFMLSSAQNYHPGTRGKREHIWQATLGPEAVVFTNHPGTASQNDSLTPNFWLGNAYLPKVIQLQDFAIVIYNIPSDARLGYTHAYFPTFAFDTYKLIKNWAFAQKDDGYIALTASSKINLTKSGVGAYRELRVNGHQTIWICQMGNRAMDGSFTNFQRKITEIEPRYEGLEIELETLREKNVKFGWNHPLIVNEEEIKLDNPNHYDYPEVYAELPAKQIDVLFNDYLLRLSFIRKKE
jgi:hypothetical protein